MICVVWTTKQNLSNSRRWAYYVGVYSNHVGEIYKHTDAGLQLYPWSVP